MLYGCGTSSLTLREKYGSFENGMLRRIFGSGAEEAI
jgi:hypothetical protein